MEQLRNLWYHGIPWSVWWARQMIAYIGRTVQSWVRQLWSTEGREACFHCTRACNFQNRELSGNNIAVGLREKAFLPQETEWAKQKSVASIVCLWVDLCELGVELCDGRMHKGKTRNRKSILNIFSNLFMGPKDKLFRSVHHLEKSSWVILP